MFESSDFDDGEHKNGWGFHRRTGGLHRADPRLDRRLREARAIRPRGARMTWMLWLAGMSAALLFAYLVYALLRAEDIE
ncbi:K+-transporting ATPase, F subunit [Burkholderia multivorans ATCC BAA-247]|nr:K+-transporting ATPase, F subunit [Burkholderia multivorans CGD2]EEE13301.1 K+-transporting ATPase, F subunit [Burkholderia multivorans CGD2M]EJO55864.1 K+-transporting ATPase, F subunit [Burkholderia multivorans ATCC BAA-247]